MAGIDFNFLQLRSLSIILALTHTYTQNYLLANADVTSSSVLPPCRGGGFDGEAAEGNNLKGISANSIGELGVMGSCLKKGKRSNGSGIAPHFCVSLSPCL